MEKQLNISEELITISEAVAAIERKNTYTVPENYFVLFPENMLLLIQDDPEISLPTGNVYSIPEGYFENFASSVLNRIQHEESADTEIQTLSPLLASLKNKETYRVPNNFFETLVSNAPNEKPEVKVVQMQPRKTNWSRYAVAASVAVILGVTGFFTFNKKLSGSAEGIAGGTVEQKINTVTDAELEDYLLQASADHAVKTSNPQAVEATLSTINDDEIKDYLKENSDPIESPFQGI